MLSRIVTKLIAGSLLAAVLAPAFAQDAPVRIGYAIARTGPWAGGAQISQEPNFIMWAEQVNAAGGLNVKGKKRKVVSVLLVEQNVAKAMAIADGAYVMERGAIVMQGSAARLLRSERLREAYLGTEAIPRTGAR